MSVRPAATAPTPADIVAGFNDADDHAAFMHASAALSAIPSAMMTDDERGDIARALIKAHARLWGKRSREAGLSD
jgi:hypothetical protein